MRFSKYFIPTLREDPADAEVVSHKLMMRAGMIRKLAAGIYDYLPLGLKSIRKVEAIVREEMNRAGAIELLMPMVLPSELWEKSGRWDVYGAELLRFSDRAGRDFCIGPTHEEIITDMVHREIRSYKQLPLNLYQIQTKFRDEIRPRFGVMRAREFIMKDAYSFDVDDEAADESYWAMFEAYTRIFERCGLEFKAVLADTGNIGGSSSHEFMVVAETGEGVIVSCVSCEYAANLEFAEVGENSNNEPASDGAGEPFREVDTPETKTVEEVASFLGVPLHSIIKTLIVETDTEPVAALVRGDHELSITKLRRLLGAELVELAEEKRIEELTGGPLGFSGPVGLKSKGGIRVVADKSLKGIKGGVTGANKDSTHLINVELSRDADVDEYADIRVAADGDPCGNCSEGVLKSTRGIEVGHVFKLGTKYSESMDAKYVDKNGREQLCIMGCFGIGIGRTVASAIEQSHDERGMILPISIAPFEVIVLPLKVKDSQVRDAAEMVYDGLVEQGVDVLLDDRDEGPGFKFKDAELIGIPLQVVIGPKTLKDGQAEIKLRDGSLEERAAIGDTVDRVVELVTSMKKRLTPQSKKSKR